MSLPVLNTPLAKDPVCGMNVNPQTAKWKTQHQGKTYYFCAPGCQRRFEEDPGRYLGEKPPAPPPAPPGAEYTCPMHPQVRQVGPRPTPSSST